MSTVTLKPFHQHCRREYPKLDPHLRASKAFFFNYSRSRLSNGGSFCKFMPRRALPIRASATETAVVETSKSSDVYFKETFPVKRTQKVEGKIFIKLDNDEDQKNWQLTVGCNLPGKWALHWGVNYVDDIGSEWDQPPVEMRPPGSIPIKDYAIETPLEKLSESEQGDSSYEVKINVQTNKNIATINFVLKDVETGAWYQHKGKDLKVLLVDRIQGDDNDLGTNNGPGPTVQLSSLLLKTDVSQSEDEEKTETTGLNKLKKSLEAFYEEQIIVREVPFDNSVTVSVRKCPETARNLLSLDTDLPGEVVVHWGVCKDDSKRWEIPTEPYPTETTVFKNKALRTVLKQKEGGDGAGSSFILDEHYPGFIFVLKLNDNTWLNYNGSDFYVPLSSSSSFPAQPKSEEQQQFDTTDSVPPAEYTDGIIKELKKLVSGISSEKIRKTKTKEVQETILREIEMLAAEAYSIFRGSTPTFSESDVLEVESLEPALKIYSGTGTGFEILCQGFNWESHKSGRWYMELFEKVPELSSLGFTVVWLPPPTDSVSPEGYMPRDLYNLNSRYGSFDELKVLVKKFHENGIKVLGDAVINHRCAEHKNQNGVWNIFGGRLNWDDRAVVSDDPHFQGRGNRSSGECFHAAPNIDHSQEFVRKDLKEWLCWLREEIGYDGWRLDFVRGFWGGYVKDYMEATEPYFAVGEYWDSLNYTYGEMDHNQDAHRQRIVDWISATNGTAGAFDVTTKGILHGALERCEYWRLSDENGKPPGVLGWWPSRAITFIENHDTGSTQGHWRFPEGKVMQGYAYILTHPGTPAVFYDHIFFFHLKSEIAALIALRNRNNIHCRSPVKITKAERDVYAAVVDEKVAMKIGPGHYEPPHNQNWSLALEGNDYKIWELK